MATYCYSVPHGRYCTPRKEILSHTNSDSHATPISPAIEKQSRILIIRVTAVLSSFCKWRHVLCRRYYIDDCCLLTNKSKIFKRKKIGWKINSKKKILLQRRAAGSPETSSRPDRSRRYPWSCDPGPGRYRTATLVQRCGTVTIFYGSGSGSDFWKSYGSGSGSGSFCRKVTVPVPVPVPAPYLDHKKQILDFFLPFCIVSCLLGKSL